MPLDQYIPKEELISISLVSWLNVSVFITIAIAITGLFFENGRLVRKVGPNYIIYLLMALIIRMFIPVEFKYAVEIPCLRMLSPLHHFLKSPVRIGDLLVIKVYQIGFIIWFVGVFIAILLKLIAYRKIRRYVSVLPVTNADDIKERLGDSGFTEMLDSVKVAYSKEVRSPYLIGFFKPLIVLPMVEYTDDQLRYIIAHELMHAKNKDIVWKVLVDILCTVFWWNPIFNYLRNQLFKMIEIRNDREIIKEFDEHEIVGYLECLMNTAANVSGKDVIFSLAFSKSNFEELQLRMVLVSENRNYSRRAQRILTAIAIFVVVIASSFVIQPSSFPNEEEAEGGVPLTSENTFLIRLEEGYAIYVNEEYVCVTNDIRPFWDVPIYDSLEEALHD